MGFLDRAYLEHLRRTEAPQYIRLVSSHMALGEHPETGDIFVLPDIDRYAGMYVIGRPGSGKSSELENLIYDDALKGNAVVVIDPHGDLIDHCLAALPEQRLPHTYLLDMEDESYPFGVNLFAHGRLESEAQRTQAIDRITHVFDVLWPDVLRQQNLPMYLRMAVFALLATPGSTLVDLLPFLLDDDFRAGVLRNRAVDYSVRQWWHTEYDALKPDARKQKVQALLNRLYTLFMGRGLIRNIIGQRRTTISFRRAIEQREIIFVRLPLKTLKADAELIGMVIVAQIHAALFSFGDIPEAQRPGFSLYIDEFQHFVTKDIEEMITEGRKFKVRLTVAHQFRDQLSEDLQKPTLATRTQIVFQTTIEDGPQLAHLFPVTDTSVKPSDKAASELLIHASDYPPAVRTFSEWYLRPLQGHIHGGVVPIAGEHWDGNVMDTLLNGFQLKEVYVDDPTPYLNALFYEVMSSGTPQLPIPWEVAVGFSNCGRGFFNAVKFKKGDPILAPSVRYPDHLVAGGRWIGAPRGAREQLYHFLFHLRATMAYLARHPVGKQVKEASSVDQWLSSLPPRYAFVRSKQEKGVIRTLDTPVRISGEAFSERLARVRAQTRATYCHPRDEIEHRLATEPASGPTRMEDVPSGIPEIAGWGEVGEP